MIKLCPKCLKSEETIEHFLRQCPATAFLRDNTFNNYFMTTTDMLNVQTLITKPNHIELTD